MKFLAIDELGQHPVSLDIVLKSTCRRLNKANNSLFILDNQGKEVLD